MHNIVYTDSDHKNNWFHEKYFKGDGNSRYFTFQTALNLLAQRFDNPIIIETGCQRQEDDIGAGMSTSIFAEYIDKHGGSLLVVDNNEIHLNRSKQYLKKWPDINVRYFLVDSVLFLQEYKDRCDLLYLDSYDYPIFEMWQKIDSKDMDNAQRILASKSKDEVLHMFGYIIEPCQKHCLNEFKAIESYLSDNTIVLIDDNNFPGGGKPGTLKPYLEQQGWLCLLDHQQTLWIRK
jgi:hypothetical protein